MSDDSIGTNTEDNSTVTNMEDIETNQKPQKSNIIKAIIAATVLVILMVSLTGSFVYYQLNKMGQANLDKSDKALGINSDLQAQLNSEEQPLNIAVFGIDQWGDSFDGRSDVIMIASINKKTRDIKLVSIMRDTYVNIPGHGMDKINHAYAFGGPQLAIKTINSNFNMNIKDFATVSCSSMQKIVDSLGGVDINVLPEELPRLDGVDKPGLQRLDGHEAVDYARIRYIGNGDYQRIERQQTVIAEIAKKVQAAGPTKLPILVSNVLPYTTTSISKIDLLKIGANVFAYRIKTIKHMRIPLDSTCDGKMIKGTYYLTADLDTNTRAVHDFIYKDIKSK